MDMNCKYAITMTTSQACPSSCSNGGKCTSKMCECNPQRTLLDCSGFESSPKEIFNGDNEYFGLTFQASKYLIIYIYILYLYRYTL
jgi:hypothetical protein